MPEAQTAPERISDTAMADLMLRISIGNSIVQPKEGIPLTDNFERARKMLVPAVREEAASRIRHMLVSFIAQQPLPEDVCREVDIEQLSIRKPPYSLEEEIDHQFHIVDPTSATSLATLADLLMRGGHTSDAQEYYARALKVARETGTSFYE